MKYYIIVVHKVQEQKLYAKVPLLPFFLLFYIKAFYVCSVSNFSTILFSYYKLFVYFWYLYLEKYFKPNIS